MSSNAFESGPPVPSRRRAPRDEVVTYRIRIDLDDSAPPIWRRLDLASNLTLDHVHDVLQTAMGWTDSHLHEFANGDGPTDRLAERYRSPEAIEDELDGIDESAVRLDEVLVEPGDRLYYTYDFGDDWAHTLVVESVAPRDPSDGDAVCVAGAGACPPEDSGGVWGYQDLLVAVNQPASAENEELREWVGPFFDPDRFTLDEVNTALAHLESRTSGPLSAVDPDSPLGDLLSRMDEIPAALEQAIAFSFEPIAEPDRETKSVMLQPYFSFLGRVGQAGITLTQAGYLPPVHVEAVAGVLNLEDIWIGKNNREVQTAPVLEFRESTQRLGLVRKAHNKLTLTKAGMRARTDVEALWKLLADALPLGVTTRGPEVQASHDAGLLLLIGISAGLSNAEINTLVAEGLRMLGWRAGPSTELTSRDIRQLQRPTEVVLAYIGVVPRHSFTSSDPIIPPAPGAAAFARAALRRSAAIR